MSRLQRKCAQVYRSSMTMPHGSDGSAGGEVVSTAGRASTLRSGHLPRLDLEERNEGSAGGYGSRRLLTLVYLACCRNPSSTCCMYPLSTCCCMFAVSTSCRSMSRRYRGYGLKAVQTLMLPLVPMTDPVAGRSLRADAFPGFSVSSHFDTPVPEDAKLFRTIHE